MDLSTLSALSAHLAENTVFGIALSNWALAAGAALVSYTAMIVLLRVVLGRAARLAGRTSNRVDDTVLEVLRRTNQGLLALIALLIGVGLLDLPARWSTRVGQLWFIVLMLQIGLWCGSAVTLGVRRYAERHAHSGNPQLGASTTLMNWGLRLVLWTVVVLAMLSNLGVNITAFVASLGVGGIAVALAVQNILGDLFASLAIAIDKPFEVGDAIAVNKLSGTVEHVGLKTTRLRAPSGEQIVISNTELLKNPLNNYKRLNERQVVLRFGVTQETTPEQAEAVPALVRKIVSANPKLRFDRAHLAGVGESSFDFEAVYVVLEASYQLHMDAQQHILLELMRELRTLGVEFAQANRSVIVSQATDMQIRQRPTEPGPLNAQTAGSR